jgi:hypothetical protein
MSFLQAPNPASIFHLPSTGIQKNKLAVLSEVNKKNKTGSWGKRGRGGRVAWSSKSTVFNAVGNVRFEGGGKLFFKAVGFLSGVWPPSFVFEGYSSVLLNDHVSPLPEL